MRANNSIYLATMEERLYGMLGILIRDRYFALHDIPLDRVDESNPNRQTP